MSVTTAVQSRDEVRGMCQQAVEMLGLTWRAFRSQDLRPLEPVAALGREIHQREKVLTASLARAPAAEGAPEQPWRLAPMHLERVGDNIELLARAVTTMIVEGVPFTERAVREVNTLFERAVELLECARDVITTGNRVLVQYVLEAGRAFEETANDFAYAHQTRLIEGVCLAKASSLYLALLDDLKGVEWHTRQIAERFRR